MSLKFRSKINLMVTLLGLWGVFPSGSSSQDFTAVSLNKRDPGRVVNITALQAGSKHYSNGNPGLDANFSRFEDLARKAALSDPRPDLICFPEYAITGWGYPAENIINGIAEPVPGNGPWYSRYVRLAKETGIPLLGWIVESADGRLYNTSFIIDGEGKFTGKYRKVHANLGEQTWWG